MPKRLSLAPYQEVGEFGCKYIKDGSADRHRRRTAFFECGKCRSVFSCLLASVRDGNTTSCGCTKSDLGKFGIDSNHPAYVSWKAMIARCTNPNIPNYHRYGGRGINVCPEWFSAENFLGDMLSSWFESAQIDRKDNEKGYFLENCHWVTIQENSLAGKKFTDNPMRGVIKRPHGWQVYVNYQGKQYCLGSFDQVHEAIMWRRAGEREVMCAQLENRAFDKGRLFYDLTTELDETIHAYFR
jgi:hypothetical protein